MEQIKFSKEQLFLGFLFFLPLVFNPISGEVESLKFYFYLIVGLILALSAGSFQIKNRFNQAGFIFLILASGLSTMLAQDPYLAFWGSVDRRMGAAGFLLALMLALSVPSILKKTTLAPLKNTLVASGCAAAVLALLLALWVPSSLFEGRWGGTLGNPDLLGQFLVFTLTLTGYQLLKKPSTLLAGAFFLQGGALLATENRASWLALFIILIILGISEIKRKWRYFFGLAAGTSVLSLIYWDRLLSSDSIQTRLELYGASVQAILEKPWLGYGFEHAPYALEVPESYTLLADRSHQLFLDMALNMGLPASLVFLALCIWCFSVLWKTARPFALAFLALLISLQFSFMTNTHLVLVGLCFGLALLGRQLKHPIA